MSLPLSKIPSNVKESFLKIGDDVEISPLFNKKRTFKLNRTKLQIVERRGHFSQNSHQIAFGATEDVDNLYEMQHVDDVNHEYFLLKTVRGNGFKINGMWVREAYLSLGDEVIIGHNKIVFKRNKKIIGHTDDDFSHLHKDLTVLIQGETGTGKSRLAKRIHESRNLAGDFLQLNISSFASSLLESELFGHVKGSFTGAIKDKDGAFKLASYGTLFIDEIDSLPFDIQTKLLLFLDHKKIRPIGASTEIQCHPHLIFASGQPLEELVRSGKMRKDFYYRIASEHRLNLLPLREDKSKIDKICENFSFENNVIISKELVSFFKDLAWPGNIRQLQGHLKKKKLTSKTRYLYLDDVDLVLLKNDFEIQNNLTDFKKFKDVKYDYFLGTYHRYANDIKVSAKALGVTTETVRSVLGLRS